MAGCCIENELDLLKKAHDAVVADNNRLSENKGRVHAKANYNTATL